MRCFVVGFFGFFVAAFLTLLAVSSYEAGAARASLAEAISAVAPLRARIAEDPAKARGAAAAESSSTQLAQEKLGPSVNYLKVTPDGTIAFRSAKHGQIIIFEPDIRGNTVVAWKCVGAPPKDVPPDCR